MSTLGTNPKQAEGDRKVPFSYLPFQVLGPVSVAMYEGVKYGAHNYRCIGRIKTMTYVDAALRHTLDYAEGNDIDQWSPAKCHNIDKAIASLLVLKDAIMNGNIEDDRPPRPSNYKNWLAEANAATVAITENTPVRKERYTELNRPDTHLKFETDSEYEQWRDNLVENS